jgi:hypothetical protein
MTKTEKSKNQKWDENLLASKAASNIKSQGFVQSFLVDKLCYILYGLDPDPDLDPEPEPFQSRNRNRYRNK